jgi:hypothetical protein
MPSTKIVATNTWGAEQKNEIRMFNLETMKGGGRG